MSGQQGIDPAAPDLWEVAIIRYGTRRTTRSEVFLNHFVYAEADRALDMDYFCWLLRGPEQDIVVDVGFSARGGRSRGRTMVTDPVEVLDSLGAGPGTAPPVVVTHAHYDHIGNLSAFDASLVHVSRRELEFWTGPLARRPLFTAVGDPAEVAVLDLAHRQGRTRLVEGRLDLAPGVRVLEVGGHTPGQLMVLVQTPHGTVLLTSDAVHYYEELERDRPFVHVADLGSAYAAFDTVRALMAEDESMHVVPGHDPAVLDRVPVRPDPDHPGVVHWLGASAPTTGGRP